MTDPKLAGRVIGGMFLLQIVGLMAGFIMLDALRSTSYIQTAAPESGRIKAGVIVLLAHGALTIAISIAAWKIVREHSHAMAVWLISLSVIMFIMQAVDTVHIMTMLALSQEHAQSGAIIEPVAIATRLTRRYAHYLALLAIDFWLALFYSILLLFRLMPRLIAGFALGAVVLQFVAVPVPGFLGYGINTNLGVPLAVGMLAVAGWLIARGFNAADQQSDR